MMALWLSNCLDIGWRKSGNKANRNTIRDDVATLNAAGIEILSERVGNGKAYHIGACLFEMAELKMLVDAVSSSRFLTKAKSNLLIEKITMLTNEKNRSSLTAKIFTADQIKTSNTAYVRLSKREKDSIPLRGLHT